VKLRGHPLLAYHSTLRHEASPPPFDDPQAQTIYCDDDEAFPNSIKRLVRSLGMEAATFASGQEFIDHIEAMPSERFECVILDVQMPGLNGLDVQERLKSGNRFPVVFITAHDEVKIRERAFAAGALAFLPKPFDAELLIEILHAAVKISADA
jgi:FixJ family two-component response regulator